MQTLTQIQALLTEANLSPRKRFGQNFLIDLNLMRKLLEAADLKGSETALEVGAGTGSLTEELLAGAARVAAVEIDTDLAALLRRRFADESRLTLIEGDVLAGKHALASAVLQAVAPGGCLVANLPYNVATPLVAECMMESWRSLSGRGVRLESLTFTVQQEVADRFSARQGGAYGPVSVLLALLGRVRLGSAVPATAFWPRPKIASRIVRVDFDPASAGRVADVGVLQKVVATVFSYRRKRVRSCARLRDLPWPAETFLAAIEQAGLNADARPEQLEPTAFLALANALASPRLSLDSGG